MYKQFHKYRQYRSLRSGGISNIDYVHDSRNSTGVRLVAYNPMLAPTLFYSTSAPFTNLQGSIKRE